MSNRVIGRKLLGALALAASLTVSGACTEPDVRRPQAIALVSGGGQEGEVGTPLALDVAVQVTDSSGRSVRGASVAFEITTAPTPEFAPGSVAPASARTDGSGVARTRWTLGSAAGQQTLRVWIGSAPTPTGHHVDVSATAKPGVLASLARVAEPIVAITVGDSVRVAVGGKDRYGNTTSNPLGLTWRVADPDVASVSRTELPPDGAAMVLAKAKGTTVLEVRDAAGHAVSFDVRTYVGPGRDIVYESNGTIYLLSADGATTALGAGTDPAWSPDGRQIAFTAGQAIHVMNADGSGGRTLTDTTTHPGARHPAWSPDGQRIAFSAPAIRSGEDGSIAGTRGALFVTPADGSAPTLVVFPQGTSASYPTWSPDGMRIAYSVFRPSPVPGGSVFIVNSDGSNNRWLMTGRIDEEASWSPDGRRLVFQSSALDYLSVRPSDLYTINADGTGLTRFTFASSTDSWDLSPAWSPDSRVAFVRAPSGPFRFPASSGPSEFFVVNGDGTGLRRVLSATGLISRPVWRP